MNRNKINRQVIGAFILMLSLALVVSCEQHRKSAIQKNEAAPVKVELKKENGKYKLYRGGSPFYIKGAGLEFGNIESLAKHGGNSFRTWRVENGKQSAQEILDEAWKHGLTVTMGIEVARERHGFDYNDSVAVAKQFEQIKEDVLRLKDHPALLIWGIGNELNLHYSNPKVWDAVNDIAKMIHEVDPNHPTTTMLAGLGKKEAEYIRERCPEIDLLSVQLYGDIVNLPKYIEESGWEGAYMVTEWGATGHWEVAQTEWKRPIEETSHQKAKVYQERYEKYIASDTTQCIGSYVFLWGQKQERTPTWYGIFLASGEELEAVDAMHYVWNGNWPENRSPQLKEISLNGASAFDNVKVAAKQECIAECQVEDPDQDKLRYQWEILSESTDLGDGGDFESRPGTVKGNFVDSTQKVTKLIAPENPGEYRLFIYAFDGNGHAGTANIPFLVE